MEFNCLHISDVHFRGLKRHEEYKAVFVKLFNLSNILKPNIIFIGGDIVHSKTQGISPELIEILTWWFNSLAKIAPTHVILGNHDGLILNEDRQDAITPIINAINNDNIFLYKKSGTYSTGIKGFNWCVFSCFDEEGWKNVKPIKDEINIACFHGGLEGSMTDAEWQMEGEVKLDFFKDYDFGFLGDIHKYQYLDAEERIAYPGSTIQQNYGEDIKKGFLYWQIKSKYDYKSKFYHIDNPHPHITVDWQGTFEKTLQLVKRIKKEARFRIRSEENISQAEIKLMHEYLKKEKHAKEIVYQTVSKKPKEITKKVNSEKIFNIKNEEQRIDLLKNIYKEEKEETIDRLNKMFKSSLSEIVENDYAEGQNWSLKSLDFENTFAYGKKNFVNFDKLRGIVGIFGNNRAGKSSIPGTLMYSLFNATDRGPIKNQYIVNSRKGSCFAKTKILYEGKQYLIERNTTKKTSKKGEVSSVTKLSFSEIKEGKIINYTEEQRRETDKVLRNIIGTSDDFLYTSFASQGNINNFISEKTTARKNVISKFLNLGIYDDLNKMSREKHTYLKNRIKDIKKEDWGSLILREEEEIKFDKIQIIENNNDIQEKREGLIKERINLENLKSKHNVHKSGFTITEVLRNIEVNESERNLYLNEKENLLNEKEIKENNISKIYSFKESFPILELKEDKSKLNILEGQLTNLSYKLQSFKKDKKQKESKLKILDNVPCDESFSHCMFIKDAYSSKENIEELSKDIEKTNISYIEVKSLLNKILENNVEDKIKKYESISKKESEINLDIERIDIKLENLDYKIKEVNKKINKNLELKEEIKLFEENNNNENIKLTEERILKISDKLNILEKDNLNLQREITIKENNIQNYKKEKEVYSKIISEWKLYDMYSSLVNKKGIPSILIKNALPLINNQISQILKNVVSFNLTIEEDSKGNNLEIYIDYGDSKRIIECGSGMEKMIASIAIRVALINISMLPRSDVFIIDEGFGALDSNNLQACGRLLKSLKSYFKSIIIISHVDTIKDIVDYSLIIRKEGQNSHVRFE